MVKVHTTLSIDIDILKSAKDMGLNLSAVFEKALKEKTGNTIMTEEEERTCNYCKNYWTEDVIFLVPDERWCCPICLKFEVKKVVIGVSTRE